MTIGIDISRLGVAARTGTEQYTYELLAALARIDQGRDYLLYCNGLPAALPPLGPRMRLRNIPFPRLWTHLRLSGEMARHPPDTLFVPAHVLPPIRPGRSVVTIHDLGYEHFPAAHPRRQRLYLRLSTLWSARAATRIIAISAATKNDLVARYRVPPAKITVIHHGVSPRLRPVEDQAVIDATCARYGITQPYFLYVGTIQPRKNLGRLVEALAMMGTGDWGRGTGEGGTRQGGSQPSVGTGDGGVGTGDGGTRQGGSQPSVGTGDGGRGTGDKGTRQGGSLSPIPYPLSPIPQLILAGKQGWLSAPIERRVAELGLGERVRFTGYVDDGDLPALLSGALAFVFPSLYEGFGMPVLEAMACGTPVLTSTTSSLPEVAGDAALLVDPADTEAIAAALGRLASDGALREELRTRGLARAAQFTWERCARETLDVLV